MFPALRSLDPGSDEPTTAAERHRAYRAARELLERLAVKQPLVLVLDDLHWADGASLELASHLFRRPPRRRVVLAVGLRPGQADHATEAVMDSARRGSASVHSIALGPLAPADAQVLMGLADPAEAERLYRRSGGNPFYMLELTRGRGDEKHGSRSAEDEGDVPSAVVAAIVRELDGLSVPARRLAEAGAVAGDPFELDLALATAGVGGAGRPGRDRRARRPGPGAIGSGPAPVPLSASAGASRGVRVLRARDEACRPRALRQRARRAGRTGGHARPPRTARRSARRSGRRRRPARSRGGRRSASARQCGPLVRACARPAPSGCPARRPNGAPDGDRRNGGGHWPLREQPCRHCSTALP